MNPKFIASSNTQSFDLLRGGIPAAQAAITELGIRKDTNSQIVLSPYIGEFAAECRDMLGVERLFLDINIQKFNIGSASVALPVFSVLRPQFSREDMILAGPSLNSAWIDLIRAVADNETDTLFRGRREDVCELIRQSIDCFMQTPIVSGGNNNNCCYDNFLFCYGFRDYYNRDGTARQLFGAAESESSDCTTESWRSAETTEGNLFDLSPTTQILARSGLAYRIVQCEKSGPLIFWCLQEQDETRRTSFDGFMASCYWSHDSFMHRISKFLVDYNMRPPTQEERKKYMGNIADIFNKISLDGRS